MGVVQKPRSPPWGTNTVKPNCKISVNTVYQIVRNTFPKFYRMKIYNTPAYDEIVE